MADRLLHFAVGAALGMALALWPVFKAWRNGSRLARPLGLLLIVSWFLGLWALIPNLLARVGCPPGLCSGWWMNIFVFHPAINAFHPGGMLVGALLVLACFGTQYAMLVAAIAWRARHPRLL